MINIAVVDDEIEFANLFKQKIALYFASCDIECNISIFHNPKECITENKTYDLYFLDIDLAGKNGMDMASQIRKENGSSPEIIFVSSVEGAVFDAFSVDALGFIRKSSLDIDFIRTMEKYIEKWNARNVKMEFRTDNGIICVYEDEIIMAEVYGHKMTLYCTNTTANIKGKLEDLLNRVKRRNFVQPYRGYIVNCNYIDKISKDTIMLDNGTKIPLSRRNQKEVKKTFLEYISRNAGR